jgi:DNA-binding SARP family transcriptional activator
MPAVGIGFLGPLQVDGAGAALSPRDRAVLAALAVREDGLASDQLADAVWGDGPPASWPKQVQICVMRLRRALGPHAIETTAGGYRLAVSGEELDTHRFEALVHRGRALAADGDPDRAASTLARGLALWRGEPFEDLDGWPPGRAEAARLAELRRSVQEDVLDARLASGEHLAVAAEAELLVAEEPLRERRWALLALAQYRSGRQADALRSLHQARLCLADQLGIDPGPELVRLEAAILRQDASLLAAAAEPPAIADDCPYKGLAAYDEADIESFFGREPDVVACLARLEATRVLAVAGPSGCGKSSLVRAGLVPALRGRGRTVRVAVPAPDLGAVLPGEPVGSDQDAPVLVVDQFEDLFALESAETVGSFCPRLVAYAQDRAPVVVVGPTTSPPSPPSPLWRGSWSRGCTWWARCAVSRCAPRSKDRRSRRGCAWSPDWWTCWSGTPRTSPAPSRCFRMRSSRPGGGATAAF